MCRKEKFKLWQVTSILKNIYRKRQYRREKRAYYCDVCNAWHLTSHEEIAPIIDFKPLEDFKKYIKQTNEETSNTSGSNN